MTNSSDDEKLNDLLTRTKALPREIEPPADAWAAIMSEIEKPVAPGEPVAPAFHRTVHIWQTPAFLVAAGFALVASSSLVTVQAMREIGTWPKAPGFDGDSQVGWRAPGPATFAEFVSIENDYISSANQLSSVLESERSTLSPETAKLKQSLAIIDGAIIEARRALAADPANRALVEMLSTSYNQKIDLLKRTTEMGRT